MIEVEMIAHTPDPQDLIELAILQCTNVWEDIVESRKDKSQESRIKYIMAKGHHSVLEHVSVTFSIRGISRSCSHQLVRHRLASYSQVSMRRADLDKLGITIPESIANNKDDKDVFEWLSYMTREFYKDLLNRDVESEDARFALPIGFQTEILVTMNLRSWMHFLKERMHPEAQWEIEEVARKIYKDLGTIVPDVFNEEMKKFWL